MFRAIGVVIILWALTSVFNSAFVALNSAAVATFNTVEQAALVAQTRLQNW